MPEMDGNKLAERVLKLYPRASVLLISGAVSEPPAVKGAGTGAVSEEALLSGGAGSVAARDADGQGRVRVNPPQEQIDDCGV